MITIIKSNESADSAIPTYEFYFVYMILYITKKVKGYFYI